MLRDKTMNDEQLLRYSRHILLADLDVAGQERLLASTVLIVGAGGLGCPAALYLAGSGVGRIRVADDDAVELSNLQRQIGHGERDIGVNKAQSLADAVAAFNHEVAFEAINCRLDDKTLLPLLEGCDLVLDCSDNFATRFMLNRLCVKNAIPLVSGAAIRAEGQLAVFDARDKNSPCYRCLYSDDNDMTERCSDSGVLSPVVGVIGSWQAVEAVKLLAGFGEPAAGILLAVDFKYADVRRLHIGKDPHCPVCGKGAAL